MASVKAAAVQMSPVLYSREGMVETRAGDGLEWVLLPDESFF
jgi:hypothetical protein